MLCGRSSAGQVERLHYIMPWSGVEAISKWYCWVWAFLEGFRWLPICHKTFFLESLNVLNVHCTCGPPGVKISRCWEKFECSVWVCVSHQRRLQPAKVGPQFRTHCTFKLAFVMIKVSKSTEYRVQLIGFEWSLPKLNFKWTWHRERSLKYSKRSIRT